MLSVVLTPWPPGPDAFANRSVRSAAAITRPAVQILFDPGGDEPRVEAVHLPQLFTRAGREFGLVGAGRICHRGRLLVEVGENFVQTVAFAGVVRDGVA